MRIERQKREDYIMGRSEDYTNAESLFVSELHENPLILFLQSLLESGVKIILDMFQ